MSIQSPSALATLASRRVAPAVPRHRLDRFEVGLLTVFGVLSMWVITLDLWQAIANDRVWTGTDGFFIVDQMQYLAWIQSASHHLLASNLFVLRGTPSDYFQPALAISAAISALGVAPWLSLLLWKPVAVLATFLAIRAVAYRSLGGRLERRAALTLGLLFGSFSVVYGDFGIVGDMMPSWLSWGYPFGLLAVALLLFALLRYDRARTAGRLGWAPGLMGGVASTLHPWQGELLILVVAGAELVRWRDFFGSAQLPASPRAARTASWRRSIQWPRLALPALTIALTGLPLVYYLLLGHLDLSWNLARDASKHTFSFWSIALAAGPLGIFAALGYRGRSEDFFELILRVWAPGALLIYVLSATALGATPLHAVNGITVPLAVLAVKGVRRTRLHRIPRGRLLATAAIALGIIPANAFAVVYAHTFTDPAPGNANFITRDERAALDYLADDPDPGGVLTQFYLGEVVPARTGRHTFVGDCLWSEPACMPRSLFADALFEGVLAADSARGFVSQSGARFVLASCYPHADLQLALGSLIVSTKPFGCATVYELGPPTEAEGPLANLPGDAAVRAQRRQ